MLVANFCSTDYSSVAEGISEVLLAPNFESRFSPLLTLAFCGYSSFFVEALETIFLVEYADFVPSRCILLLQILI